MAHAFVIKVNGSLLTRSHHSELMMLQSVTLDEGRILKSKAVSYPVIKSIGGTFTLPCQPC